MVEIKEGNQCLFMMFAIFNFLVFLSSLGILSSAIYLFVLIKETSFIAIGFLVGSLILLLASSLAFKLRKSIHMLGCYLFILFVLFTVLMLLSLILTFSTGMAKKWAKVAYDKAVADGDLTESVEKYV